MDADPTEGYLRRAELLAELGHYDEAVAELDQPIARDPGNSEALVLLAAVELAAGRAEAGLAAARRACAADPDALPPLVEQGLALCDLRRFKEAAAVADQILAAGPDDPYAQLHGAAILGEARNGQRALDAAWHAVALEPDNARAHLVLAGIAGRLELTDLAERARGEAVRLDPKLATVSGRLRRYAPLAVGDHRVTTMAVYASAYTVAVAVLTATLHPTTPSASRGLALVFGAGGLGLLGLLAMRLPKPLRGQLHADRASAVAGYAALAGPLLILLYAWIGTPWPLVVAIAATAVAGVALVSKMRL
ncbi:tetratricopeptide repeat protein [Asanoa ferruginea]|uniref:Tetratricopeptide repeat protein n=1 Tax=Asanoa ferruginea TaxID=53367 RepID=A0A3D9ZJJ0_9ACTN|nr:tetratricopeptide repeat protein [Asanoa ferruginea]REF96642.1 tetratricopeptide repeat protein [Asanoa ferruginea]